MFATMEPYRSISLNAPGKSLMKISKEKLQQEAADTGFKMEHLEKVYMLMDLLEDIASFPQLKDKFF